MTDTISRILDNFKTIAVVGLSPKPHRDSHEVSEYMQAHGYRIVPVNPAALTSEILGEKVYPSLLEAAKHEHIDLVNVFRNSADVPPVVDDAIAIGAKAVWLQLGVINLAAAKRAEDAGLQVVMDRCPKIEIPRLSVTR